MPSVSICEHPVSDGGEGLVDLLVPVLGGSVRVSRVSGPLPGQKVEARWGYAESGQTAVIEMAQAAGLPLVPPDRRDPRVTTTYGVGEVIRLALDAGAKTLVVGIGGSATVDGGAGMAEALGARFTTPSGQPIVRGGAGLADLASIDTSGVDQRLHEVRVIVACDVQNPLLGPEGAAAVYAPQKGATPEDVRTLERALRRYSDVLLSDIRIDVRSYPGGGAAGGLGAGLLAFCGAELKSGIDVMLDATSFDDQLRRADCVITGEGKIDRQVAYGKAIAGVLRRANASNVPVIGVVGCLEGSLDDFRGTGRFYDLITLVNERTSVQTAIENAAFLIRQRTIQLLQQIPD